jgi:lysophospholipase L1-like esterase
MKKILRLVFINIVVFFSILVLINISLIVIYKSYNLIKPDKELRSGLPNYTNIKWAGAHFKEFNNLPAEYRSYTGWRRLPFKGETINIDKNGVRSTRLPEADPDSLPFAVFTGGSALWGTGANDDSTIPSMFTAVSENKYYSLNFGESGYNAFQGYLFLKIQVMNGLKPGVIVAYDGANETDGLRRGNRIFSHSRENQIKLAVKGLDRGDNLSLRHFFADPVIAFINIFKTKFHKTTAGDFDLSDERVDSVAAVFLRSWKSVKELADQNQALFVGVLQPTIYRGNPRIDHLIADKSLESVYIAFYNAVLKKLKEPEFIELSENVLDLGNAFDTDEYIYIDDVHVSPNGNRIAAERIYSFVMDLKQKKTE